MSEIGMAVFGLELVIISCTASIIFGLREIAKAIREKKHV